MPSSQYNRKEVEFLLGYLPQWISLGASKPAHGQVSPRVTLVRDIIAEFFVRFPERDPANSEGEGGSFSESVVSNLPNVCIVQLIPLATC